MSELLKTIVRAKLILPLLVMYLTVLISGNVHANEGPAPVNGTISYVMTDLF